MTKRKKRSGKGQTAIIAMAAVAFLVMMGYLMASNSENNAHNVKTYHSQNKGLKTIATTGHERLVETRPVLSYEYFTGRVAKVYRWATEIPEVFDALYCYCMCEEILQPKHKNLLTCYVSRHASRCEICLHEGEMAWKLTQWGKTTREIRLAVDDYYAKLRGRKAF